MRCVKTGCTVLVNGLAYHGDLMASSEGLTLTGVPKLLGDKFSLPIGEKLYHCEAQGIEFLGTSSTGYGEFALFDVEPTKEFLSYLNQWSFFSLPCFNF